MSIFWLALGAGVGTVYGAFDSVRVKEKLNKAWAWTWSKIARFL